MKYPISKLLLLISICMVFNACNELKVVEDVPEPVLSYEQMVAILMDVHIAEAQIKDEKVRKSKERKKQEEKKKAEEAAKKPNKKVSAQEIAERVKKQMEEKKAIAAKNDKSATALKESKVAPASDPTLKKKLDNTQKDVQAADKAKSEVKNRTVNNKQKVRRIPQLDANGRKDVQEKYNAILGAHGVSYADFDQSIHYYGMHPEEMHAMYEDILERFSALEAKMRGIKDGKVAAPPKKKSEGSTKK